MSMFSTFSDAVQASFTTITKTVESAQKGLDILNDHVDNAHKSMTRNSAKAAILNSASQHARIQTELEADPKLAEIFEMLEAEWDLPRAEWTKASIKPVKSVKGQK